MSPVPTPPHFPTPDRTPATHPSAGVRLSGARGARAASPLPRQPNPFPALPEPLTTFPHSLITTRMHPSTVITIE